MDSPDIQRIRHILLYCEKVAATIQRYGNDYATFSTDGDYFDSVSMKLLQIGELSAGLSEEFKERTREQMQWGALRGMRNMFAHAYAKMNKETVWEAATLDVPGLQCFCEKVLAPPPPDRARKRDKER